MLLGIIQVQIKNFLAYYKLRPDLPFRKTFKISIT